MRTYTKQVKPNSTGARERLKQTSARQVVNSSPVLFNRTPPTGGGVGIGIIGSTFIVG